MPFPMSEFQGHLENCGVAGPSQPSIRFVQHNHYQIILPYKLDKHFMSEACPLLSICIYYICFNCTHS